MCGAVERLAAALEQSRVDIVPRVQISAGEGQEAGGGLVSALLGLLVSEKGMSMVSGPTVSNDTDPPKIAAE